MTSAWAMLSRSGIRQWRSSARHRASRQCGCRTDPPGRIPHTATVSSFTIYAFSAAMYPVGKMSDRKTTCSSGILAGTFSALASALISRESESFGHATVFAGAEHIKDCDAEHGGRSFERFPACLPAALGVCGRDRRQIHSISGNPVP